MPYPLSSSPSWCWRSKYRTATGSRMHCRYFPPWSVTPPALSTSESTGTITTTCYTSVRRLRVRCCGRIFLLFWLSLLPFPTGWMGENHFSTLPILVYGVVLLNGRCRVLPARTTIICAQGPDSILKQAVGRDRKGKLLLVLCVAAVVASGRTPWIAEALFVVLALVWLIPDRWIENVLRDASKP